MIEKRFTDIWCSETGQIGITDNGVDLIFMGDALEIFLNELVEENEQLRKQVKILKKEVRDFVHLCDVCDILNSLNEENEELKEENEHLRDARASYKDDWKTAVAYCDTYKQEIDFLKDELEGFEKENRLLREQLREMFDLFNHSGLDYHISDELEEFLND